MVWKEKPLLPHIFNETKYIKVIQGFRVQAANVGGNWNNGSNAGLFYWNLNNTSSNTNVNIGGRLLIYCNFYSTLSSLALAKN